MPSKAIADQQLVGRRFTRLVVVRQEGKTRHGEITWLCQCDCGKQSVVRGKSLRASLTHSCGCFAKDQMSIIATKHGKRNSRAYRAWSGMKARCSCSTNKDFEKYGGRGIGVCHRWMDFENFYADMGDPLPRMSLDRIDVNGNYEPSNCRWATFTTQNRNRRDSIYVEYEGKRMHLNEVAAVLGITRGAAALRLKRGTLNAKVL